jgi:hypothetical protein
MSVYRVGGNKSSQNVFPSVRPTLDLDFANSKTLDPRITFTRSSGGSYVGADGLIKYAGVNEARFDHDPISGESLGLLIEKSRTNSITYSDISTSWNTPGGTVSQDGQLSPDGIFQSYKYIPNTDNNFKGITKTGIPTSSGSSYTVSAFVKNGGYDNLLIFIDNVNGSGGRVGALFNLSTKQINVGGLNTAGYSYDYGIIDFNNGWYRIYITTEVNTSSISITYRFTNNVSGYVNTSGDGTSGIYIWGAQLEEGAFPTSYIPTQASTRTRASDRCNISSSTTTEFTNNSEMTMVSKVRSFCNVTQDNFAIGFNEGTSTVRGLLVNILGTSLQTRIGSRSDTFGATVYTNPNPIGIGDWATTALAFKSNVGYHCHFGGRVVERTNINTTSFVLTNLFIGDRGFATSPLNGHINFIRFYPRRLPNEQLIALTR